MKLVLTLLVRDEADIIRANVEHHLRQGVDLIVAMDNGSVDGTREILSEYEADGTVVLIDEPGDDYQQWSWVTRMARMAARDLGADWVIHADADEFWWPDDGDLKSTLAGVPGGDGWLIAPRCNMVPTGIDDQPFFERLVVRDRWSRNSMGRPLLGKICHRSDGDVWIAQGNHELHSDTLELGTEPPPVTILHFPLRTYEQLERKVVLGGRAYARNTELERWIGDGWRFLYQLYLRGDLREWYAGQVPSAAELAHGFGTGRYLTDLRVCAFCRDAHIGDHPPPVARSPAASPGVIRSFSGPTARRDSRASLEPLLQPGGGGSTLEARLVEFIDAAESGVACAASRLSATAVAAALASAQRRGVDVRVLQSVGGRHVLSDWGVEVSAAPEMLHHVVVRDTRSVWTGSAELTAEGLHGCDADCAIVHSRTIACAYLEAFRISAHPASSPPVPLVEGEAQALFTPGDSVRALVAAELDRAERVRILAGELTDPVVLAALHRCTQRGADVAGVFDCERMAGSLSRAALEPGLLWFLADGRFVTAPSGSVASQLVVVDDELVVTGSAALSARSSQMAGDALVIRSPALASFYLALIDAAASGPIGRASRWSTQPQLSGS